MLNLAAWLSGWPNLRHTIRLDGPVSDTLDGIMMTESSG